MLTAMISWITFVLLLELCCWKWHILCGAASRSEIVASFFEWGGRDELNSGERRNVFFRDMKRRFLKWYLGKWRNVFHSETEKLNFNDGEISKLEKRKYSRWPLKESFKNSKRPSTLCPLLLSFFFRSAFSKSYFSHLFSNIKIGQVSLFRDPQIFHNLPFSSYSFQTVFFTNNVNIFFKKLIEQIAFIN